VPELGPLTITARNRDQAEYLVRSRAQQRGVTVQGIDVVPAGPGAWLVTIDVGETDADKLAEAALEEDTQVLHFRSHPPRSPR
jgi:sarcosine oxidase gamma subunit